MSENIPESVPTSADPRSKRPLKKRAISPRSETAKQVEALFKKPDQDIRIPSSTALTTGAHIGAPPEIVANVQGSSAGAGSGEFHVYKASRRREYERLRAMDEEVRSEKEGEEWEKERREREEKDREKTRKNREKRERLKAKKGKGKGAVASNEATNVELKSGVKARVNTSRTSNGAEERNGQGQSEEAVGTEPVGVIIHDDD